MTCHSCGGELTETARFCTACGVRVAGPEVRAAPASEAAEAPTVVLDPVPTAPLTQVGAPAPPEAPGPAGAGTAAPTKTKTKTKTKTNGRRGLLRRTVAIVLAGAVVGGVGGVVLQARSGRSGGATSPQAAVRGVLDGVVAGDPVRVVRSLDPAEVSSVTGAVETLLSRATEAGLTKARRTPLAGVAVRLTGLGLREERVADNVVKVVVESGRLGATVTRAELAAPIRGAVRTADSATVSGEVDLGQLRLGDIAGRGQAPFIVTVKRGGRWFVSPLLTGVEYLSAATGRSPDYTPLAKDSSYKAASGTEAVQRLASAGSDPRLLSDALPEAEARAVQALAGTLSEPLQSLRSLRVGVSNLSEEKAPGGRRIVRVGRATVSGAVDGGNGPISFGAELDRDCVRATGDSGGGRACSPDVARRLGLDGLRLVTLKDRGQWRVSLVETAALYLGDALRKASTAQIQYVAGQIGGPALLASLPVAATVQAAGGSTDVRLNDAGFAVVGIEATAGQAFGARVDAGGDVSVKGIFDPRSRVWGDYPSGVVLPAESGQHHLVLRGAPRAQAHVVVAPVKRMQGELGTPISGAGDDFVLLEITAPPGERIHYEGDGVEYGGGEPSQAAWVGKAGDYDEVEATAPVSDGGPDRVPAGGKVVFTLAPDSSDGTWTFHVDKQGTGFPGGTTTLTATYTGSAATHEFSVVAGPPVTVTLTPRGWDASLVVTCDGERVGSADSGYVSDPETITVRPTGDQSCTAAVGGYNGTGPYTLSLG